MNLKKTCEWFESSACDKLHNWLIFVLISLMILAFVWQKAFEANLINFWPFASNFIILFLALPTALFGALLSLVGLFSCVYLEIKKGLKNRKLIRPKY